MSYKLSIITPVLKGIHFIGSCIVNVIEQKGLNMEHLIVYSGSTNGSVEIIKRYAERYEHIRWVGPDKGEIGSCHSD